MSLARTPLSRDRIIEAAVALADTEGLGALSMRKVGEAVGVEAMSLYNHVSNKHDLVLGCLESVLEEIDVTDHDDWVDSMRAITTSLRDVLLRHPWASMLLSSEPDMVGPTRLRKMDAILRLLRHAGFSIQRTHHAFHVIETYVVGFASAEVTFPHDTAAMPDIATGFLETLTVAEYPYLAEHIQYHVDSGALTEDDFAFGLDLILDGLERLRAQ